MQADESGEGSGGAAGERIPGGAGELRGFILLDGACGDGMSFVQTPRSETSCECET